MSDRGHIELERSVSSIVIGERHRRDPGDLTPLMDSMKRVGLLQPVTITPDGYLICGYRRLEAAKQLGWNTLRVWVRSGISDELTRLLAERDENVTHKPLSHCEAAKLYDEMKALLHEDADRRKKATQFGPENDETAGQRRSAESAGPRPGSWETLADALQRWSPGRRRTPGWSRSWRWSASPPTGTLEGRAEGRRRRAGSDPQRRAGRPGLPAREGGAAPRRADEGRRRHRHRRAPRRGVQAAGRRTVGVASRRTAPAARPKPPTRKRSTRSFALKWAELDGWSKKYDVEQIAREIKPDDWALFLRVIDETKAFAEAVNLAKESGGTPES